MCVYGVSEIETLKEDMVAYKLVVFQSQGLGISLCAPSGRVPQKMDEAEGTFYPNPLGVSKQYRVGEKVESSFEDTPGLYCYTSYEDARKEGLLYLGYCYGKCSIRLLEVLIPAGTRIKKGVENMGAGGLTVILAEEVLPVEMCEKDLGT